MNLDKIIELIKMGMIANEDIYVIKMTAEYELLIDTELSCDDLVTSMIYKEDTLESNLKRFLNQHKRHVDFVGYIGYNYKKEV